MQEKSISYGLDSLGHQVGILVDAEGHLLTELSNITTTGGALDVNIKSGITLTVDLDANDDSVLVYGYDSDAAVIRKIKVGTGGQVDVDVLSSALPLGAATEATLSSRATEATLAGIKTDTDKFTFTTNRLLVDGSGVTQPVSGTVAVTQTTSPWVISGTVTSNQGTSPWVTSLASTTITGTVAVTQSTSPWVVSGTVTSNIGTTNGLALDATVSALEVAQASTTSGQSGPLIQGAATTAAPSYTTAKTYPLSLTTVGNLRVDGSSVTQPVSGTFFQATQPISAASLPLPTGAATEATLLDIETDVDSIDSGIQTLNSLIPSVYDYISLGYSGSNLTTVLFKSGGSGGSTVSTLTLAYTGARLDSVTKT